MGSNFSFRVGLLFAVAAFCFSSGALGAESPDKIPTDKGDIQIQPLNHATFTLDWNGKKIFVDPVGGAQRFKETADLILVTDIHGDHLNADTIKAVSRVDTQI